jgi:rhodanese-related sulfurtransferase
VSPCVRGGISRRLHSLLVVPVLVVAAIALLGGIISRDYEKFLNRLYKGTVPLITVEDVHELLQEGEPVRLLDARTAEEFSVSHLPSARYVGYESFSADRVLDIPKKERIVVYCAVGYRSERVGEKLIEAGYRNVSNMKGGIFAWVNRGFPLYDDEGPTSRVHGYSKRWSRWLERGDVVYKP